MQLTAAFTRAVYRVAVQRLVRIHFVYSHDATISTFCSYHRMRIVFGDDGGFCLTICIRPFIWIGRSLSGRAMPLGYTTTIASSGSLERRHPWMLPGRSSLASMGIAKSCSGTLPESVVISARGVAGVGEDPVSEARWVDSSRRVQPSARPQKSNTIVLFISQSS